VYFLDNNDFGLVNFRIINLIKIKEQLTVNKFVSVLDAFKIYLN
jgi:hypothetical protein